MTRTERFWKHLQTAPLDNLQADIWIIMMRINQLASAGKRGFEELQTQDAIKGLLRVRLLVKAALEDQERRNRVRRFLKDTSPSKPHAVTRSRSPRLFSAFGRFLPGIALLLERESLATNTRRRALARTPSERSEEEFSY